VTHEGHGRSSIERHDGVLNQKKLITIRQIEFEYGLPPQSTRDCILAGEIPVVRIGRRWWVQRTDLDHFIEQRRALLSRDARVTPASVGSAPTVNPDYHDGIADVETPEVNRSERSPPGAGQNETSTT
jgi:hypothetical protein